MTVQNDIIKAFGDQYHITDAALMRKLQTMASVQTYEKGEIIQRCGEKQRLAMFLLDGVVRFSFISGKGEEVTDCFVCDFGYPIMTPDVGRPSFMTVEAVNQVRLLSVSLEAMFGLMEEHTQALWAYNQMLSWALMFHWQIKACQVCFNGAERYAWFRKNFPEADRVAYGKHIASFLGVTPETLSRIKKSPAPTEDYPVMIEMKTEATSDELLEKMKNGFAAGRMDVR